MKTSLSENVTSDLQDCDYAFQVFYLLFSIHVVYCKQMSNTTVLYHLS